MRAELAVIYDIALSSSRWIFEVFFGQANELIDEVDAGGGADFEGLFQGGGVAQIVYPAHNG